MDTAVVSVKDVFLPTAKSAGHEQIPERRFAERRRSPRVTLTRPLRCLLAGAGPASIETLSLKGATLVSSFRPRSDSTCRLRVGYGNVCVDIDVSIYRTVVHELFYSAELGSRIRFSSSVTFDDPSIATLNLVYRILREHWVDPGDDDTNPFAP